MESQYAKQLKDLVKVQVGVYGLTRAPLIHLCGRLERQEIDVHHFLVLEGLSPKSP